MVTIATWNINSIKARLDIVKRWLEVNPVDFLLLQEIKCKNEAFPEAFFNQLGYDCHINGQPAYHGVATLSRHPTTLVTTTVLESDTQPRFIDIEFKDIHLINIYAPNGNPIGTEKFEYKLKWLAALIDYVDKLRKRRIPFAVLGDFNIIPEDQDAKIPDEWVGDALMQPESRQAWHHLIELGLTDAYRHFFPTTQHAFTFWDYQAGAWPRDNGIRIDHALLSPQLLDHLVSCRIDRTPRGWEKPSDHTPLIIELES